jgi:hypothetical protein
MLESIPSKIYAQKNLDVPLPPHIKVIKTLPEDINK